MGEASTRGVTARPAFLLCSGLLLLIAFHLLAMLLGQAPDFSGNHWYINWDTDSYSRILRVIRLHESGAWFDSVAPYYNGPYGLEMHWSRALDLLLYGGAWLGSLVTDFNTALEIWAMLLLGPIGHFAFIPLLYWACRPLNPGRGFLLLILMLLSLNVISAIHLAGFIDYHGLLALFVLAQIAVLIHSLEPGADHRRLFNSFGLVSGIAVWMTIESLILIFPALLSLVLLWLVIQGQWLAQILRFCLVSTLTMALCLAIERSPNQWLVVEYDRISIVQILLGATLTLTAGVLQQLERRGLMDQGWMRFSFGFILTALCLGTLIYFFPALAGNPQQQLGEIVDFVLDGQPAEQPYRTTLAGFLKELGPLLLVLPYLLYGVIFGEGTRRQRFALYGVFILFFTGYLLLKGRAIIFLQIALLLPWFETLLAIWRALQARLNRALLRALQIPLLALVFVHYLPAELNELLAKDTYAARGMCNYQQLLPYLDDEGSRALSILAPVSAGPAIAYHTPYSVITSPYHRNIAGIEEGFILGWGDPDDPQIREIAAQRKLAYVMVCRHYLRSKQRFVDLSPDALYPRLLRDNPPSWLSKVNLPNALEQQFILYRWQPPLR